LGGEIASGPPPVSLGRVTERTDDPGVIDFFRYLGWLLGGTLSVPHDYSAGSLFYGVKKQIETLGHYPSQSYWVKGGSGAIAGPLIEAIEERGGEIRTGSAVAIWDIFNILSDDWEGDIRELFPGIVEKAHWRLRSFGPATLIETPGNVGSSLMDIQAEGVDGLYLIGERTSAAKIMGVYGSAQVALEACNRIMTR
jgi:hypothetical protein